VIVVAGRIGTIGIIVAVVVVVVVVVVAKGIETILLAERERLDLL